MYLLYILHKKYFTVQYARLQFRGVALVLAVENVGFCCLMDHLEPRYSLQGRKYSETALPKLYKTVREHISCRLLLDLQLTFGELRERCVKKPRFIYLCSSQL